MRAPMRLTMRRRHCAQRARMRPRHYCRPSIADVSLRRHPYGAQRYTLFAGATPAAPLMLHATCDDPPAVHLVTIILLVHATHDVARFMHAPAMHRPVTLLSRRLCFRLFHAPPFCW